MQVDNLSWFPGHMAKTRRMITAEIKNMDAVCEILDARIPLSSRNPDVDELTAGKPRLVVLNRVDQADPGETRRWAAYFREKGYAVLEANAKGGAGTAQFAAAVRELLRDKLAAWAQRGQAGRTVRVMVLGIPNVGKSTLVNRLAQTSDAIVHESRGVTRDRSYHTADWNGREFTIVDTGGIEPLKSDDVFATSIRDQALAAAEEAAVILFVVDGRTGVTEEDESVARMLKRCDKPVFLLVNKLDNPDRENDSIWEFYSLGIGEPTPLSALHGHGTGDLLDDIVALLPEEEDEVADEFPDALNVAIIGRPNAGKSSLFNRILGADRSIVSNIAGTTRDAIDTVVERNGKHYRMVDTAGIRKKSTVYENIEYYSMVRGLRAIDRADVALLVVDASVGVTEQDQKVMGLAIERGCAIVVLLNKWDLLDDDRKREACMETIDRRLGVMAPWAQYLRISALTGRSVEKIWAMVDAAEKTRSQKISTSRLNTFLTDLREFGHTVVDGKRRLRMHYVTQTGVNPPTFTFFVNHSDLVNDTYQRYVENRMRSTFDFAGTPIRLFFRKKEQKDA